MDNVKGIPNYVDKALYLMKKQNFMCAIGALRGKRCKATEIHHRLHNTKPNRKRFPLFINSVFNLWLVNHDCHMENPSAGKPTLLVADEIEVMLMSNHILDEWAQKPEQRISLEILPSIKAIYALLDYNKGVAIYDQEEVD